MAGFGEFNRAQTPYIKNKYFDDAYNMTADEFNQAATDVGIGYAGGAVNNDSWLGNLQAQGKGLAESLGGLQGIASGLGAAGNLWNAYNAYKGMKLAKDKFNFEKQLANANYTNQAKSYNEELGRSADVGLALAGSSMTPEQKAAYQAKINTQKVAERL